MPYIKQEQREDVEYGIEQLVKTMDMNNPGIMNYVITSLLDRVYELDCYANINSAIGALECAKLELYRRIAAPYEDTKIQENGDVY